MAQRDAAIIEAVTARLGSAEWQLEDLKGRLQLVTWAGQPGEDWFLDGSMLIRFGKPKIEQAGNVVTLSQAIEALPRGRLQ